MNKEHIATKASNQDNYVSTDKKVVLDSANPIEFRTMREALSYSLSKGFDGWQQSCWPTRNGNGKFRIWFPQLANMNQEKKVAASNNCVNVLSDDWNTLTYDDLRKTNEEFQFKGIINLIFAREPHKGPYIFRGVFLLDEENSSPNHYIYRRIGTKVRMIGKPAYDIEIVDEPPASETSVQILTCLEKPIVTFACSKTYDLINNTHIHAHPVTSSFPSFVYPYIMARAKGGITEYLYKVVDSIELNPMDRHQVNSLSTKYPTVKNYIDQRLSGLGFSKAPIPYRFYILEPVHRFCPAFVMEKNIQGYTSYSFEEIGLTKPVYTSKYVKLAGVEANARLFVDYVHSQEHNTKPLDFITAGAFLAKAESYKTRIAREAREVLKTSEWDENWIGTGKIAKRICKAIDMSGNLVFPSNKMNFKDHFDVERPEYDSNAEKAIYNIFCGKDEKAAFEYATEIFGKKYPTLAYLFFIKDDTRYLPTSPENFDKSFKRLQIDFSMSGKCNWENYCEFIEIIREVGAIMPRYMDLAHIVRLIDAHSFVWILSGKEFTNWEISRDLAKAREVATMKKQLVNSINNYVKQNGTDTIKSASEILRIAELSDKAGVILPSDYCYNRYNKGLYGFGGPFLFEYLGTNQYKLLGENYPYNGPISHKPKGKPERIIGSWTSGYVDITDKDVDWKEYKKRQDKTENKQIKAEDEALEKEIENLNLKGTDRLAVVKERVNQGVFRSRLLRKYKKCCLCGFDETGLLIASHIKPWAESNPDERTDANNGLLLCPNHDKLFDKYYFTFDEDGNIQISNKLNDTHMRLMNINSDMKMDMSHKTKTYMEYHRRKFLLVNI